MSLPDDEIIDRIYAASLVPELWPSVIDALSDRLSAVGGSIFILSEGRLAWEAPERTRAIMEAYIAGGWHEENTRLDELLARAHPGFVEDRELLGDELPRTRIREDFLLPNGIAFTAATVVKGARDDLAVFSVDRGPEAGPFSGADLQWLDGLRPHLGRSIALSGRLKMQQAAGATAAMQLLGIPACVLSASRQAIATNALFDSLSGRVFLPAAFGRLALFDRRADRMLRQALDVPDAESGPVRSIPVVDERRGPVGVLHVIPARRQARDVIGDGTTLLILAQPSTDQPVEADWLKWLYDLSPTEAVVASRLCGGKTVDDIALQNGSSTETVRTHVKNILRKTGFRRQVDFILSAGSLSAIRPR